MSRSRDTALRVQATDIDNTIASRALVLSAYLPEGPFSARTFLEVAIGLNAVSSTNEAHVLRVHLADVGVIVDLGTDPETWALA